MSNAILFRCYGKSQIAILITKHINRSKSIHDKIAHQQLNIPLLIVEVQHKNTEEYSDKNIGSRS